MKLYCSAIFLKEDDGRYSVSFPDVPEAITCGYDFENAVEMAKECLELCIKGRMEDNEEIPRAHFENIDIKETVVKIELNLTGLDDNKKSNESVKTESLLFYVYSKVFILKIKITVTIFINKNSLIAIKDIDIITMTIFFTNIH